MTKSLPPRTDTEFSLSVQFDTGLPDLPLLPLKGNLDRIDYDEAGTITGVIDYKTGKPKSRNHIMGETAGSDGGYYRQLVFYALLLELQYGEGTVGTRTGTLSFVESTGTGLREEVFTITLEEVADLRTTISAAAAAMTSGTWITATDPADSTYGYLFTD